MRWPCVLVVALARSRKFVQSALSLSISLFCCDASHVVILQLDKPFVFLEYTHTHVFVCMRVVCIFLRVNLHSYFSHCCIFFKLVLPFSLLFLLLFNTCSLDFVVVVFVIIARPQLLLLLLCRTYLIGFLHIHTSIIFAIEWKILWLMICILFNTHTHTHSRPNHNATC